MKLRSILAAPLIALTDLIDPLPPPTFWERIAKNMDWARLLQSWIGTAHTAYVHAQQEKGAAVANANASHLADHVRDLQRQIDGLKAADLIRHGIKDGLPRQGEVLGDYLDRLAQARVGGLLWVWDERWKALGHHLRMEDWTPEPNVGERAAAAVAAAQASAQPPPAPGA